MADLSPAAKAALETVQPGRKEHESRLKRYDNAYDIYRATATQPLGTRPWQSKLRVPFGRQVIDTAMVNIVSGDPRVVVRPRRPEWAQNAKFMQIALDYFKGEDELASKQPVFAQQALIYGVTLAKNHWLYRTAKRPGRQFAIGPDGMYDSKVVLEDITVRDGPTFEPWNIYNAFWEPGARSADDAAYVVLQTYASKDDLKRNECTSDHSGEPCNGIYHNVAALLETGEGPKPPESAQSRALALGFERMKGKFLIEEVWTDEQLLVLGNQQIVLRAQQNPYWHGKKPVVIAQPMPDLFELQGIGETEAVNHLQQALWTIQNMRMDNLHLTVMRGVTYREGGVIDPNSLELKPRFKWAVQDHDDVRPFEVQPLPPEAYREEEGLLARMQLVTGINPYVSGADTQGVDQNTATGITALQEVASRLLRFKASQLHYKGYQPSYRMWGDMIQQFLTEELAVEIVGPGNKGEWHNVGPAEVAGHFDYILEGSEESLSRQQERGEAIALLNAFAPLVATGTVNLGPLLERVAVAYDFPNPEALLPAPNAQPPAAPNQGQQQLPPGPQMGALPPGAVNQVQGFGQTLDPRIMQAITQGR